MQVNLIKDPISYNYTMNLEMKCREMKKELNADSNKRLSVIFVGISQRGNKKT